MYRNQFLLTTQDNFKYKWPTYQIGAFNLYCHPELKVSSTENGEGAIFLLGSIYSWKQPELTNDQIVKALFCAQAIDELVETVSSYMGEYVIIWKSKKGIFILNDACGSAEVFYDENFSSFGTQPKIIAECIELKPHTDALALDYYTSDIFKAQGLFVGTTTHARNIFHLHPNHYIEIQTRAVNRFFPIKPKTTLSVNEVSTKAANMLSGFIKAVALRDKIAIAVTGGLDSRVLFLASLDIECKYFVLKTKDLFDEHFDLVIPKQLTSLFNKKFEIIPAISQLSKKDQEEYENSIDFPRNPTICLSYPKDTVYINGNISEIARNYFGYHVYASGKDLSYLSGFSTHPYPSLLYSKWLRLNKKYFNKNGYHYLDMFYWEERMGNWCAKAFTEEKALGFVNVTPYNSRELLNLMLSVKRRYRDFHFNKLYENLIKELTPKWEEVFKLPLNPVEGQNKIRKLKKLGVYEIYSYYKLKKRTLTI